MKITIDTQHDTYEDIKKVLHILTTIIEHKEGGVVSGVENAPADTTSMMNMFSTDGPKSRRESEGTAPDFGSFLNLANGKAPEKKPDMTEIEVY